MLRYRTTKLSVGDGGYDSSVVLNVLPGQTVTLRGFTFDVDGDYFVSVKVDDDKIAEVWTKFRYGTSPLLPLDSVVKGPATVTFGFKDKGGGAKDCYMSLCYDDGE